MKTRPMSWNMENLYAMISEVEVSNVEDVLKEENWIQTMQE